MRKIPKSKRRKRTFRHEPFKKGDLVVLAEKLPDGESVEEFSRRARLTMPPWRVAGWESDTVVMIESEIGGMAPRFPAKLFKLVDKTLRLRRLARSTEGRSPRPPKGWVKEIEKEVKSLKEGR